MHRVNLLPKPRVARRRVRQRITIWSGVLSGAWLVAGGGVVLASVAPDGSNDALRRAIADVEAQVAEEIASAEQSAAEVAQMGARLEVAQALERRRDRSDLLVTIGELVGDDVVLRRLTLERNAETRRDEVGLQGTAIDQPAVTGFVLRLQDSGTLESVDLKSARRVDFGTGQTIDFSIEGILPEAERGGS